MGDYSRTILYPTWHYILIAATIITYVVAQMQQASVKHNVAAGCAAVLFCVSVIDSEGTWTGAVTNNPGQLLLDALVHYFTAPITNGLVVYVLLRNVFGRAWVNAWAYTLLCIVHTPLSAYTRYIAH
jgi:hypothetical protein